VHLKSNRRRRETLFRTTKKKKKKKIIVKFFPHPKHKAAVFAPSMCYHYKKKSGKKRAV